MFFTCFFGGIAVVDARILVVDDEPQIAKLTHSILQQAGYTVFTAGGVVEARETLANRRGLDLVVTDMNMPDGSGLDLVRHVHRLYPDIGVVAATIIDNPMDAAEILEAGVYGYIVKPFSRNLVLITVANALRRRELELRARSSFDNLESRLHLIINTLHAGLLLMDESMEIREINTRMQEWFTDAKPGNSVSLLDNHHLSSVDNVRCGSLAAEVLETGRSAKMLGRFLTREGEKDLQITMTSVCTIDGGEKLVLIMLEDQTEQLLLERELRQAQKLEAIGQLAAGIAHEINTPIQYVGDNIHFFADAFRDIINLVDEYEQLLRKPADNNPKTDVATVIRALKDEADMDFLAREVPQTITQSLEGVARVGSIIKAMREFSHPGTAEKTLTDINHCLESTVTVCRNEWKYTAELELKLDQNLEAVFCLSGEMNQVFLNLIINAAHAISARVEAGDYTKGLITITTQQDDGHVLISISDNGGGIPESIRYRVFDPFFTTKEIGKGTGQGLAIARNIITEKHGGSIQLETTPGEATTFLVRLPSGET
ncbi:MAG: response regulator [Desulfopila sp.]